MPFLSPYLTPIVFYNYYLSIWPHKNAHGLARGVRQYNSLWLFFLYRIYCLSTSFQAPKREIYCCRVESAIVNYGSDSDVFLVYTALFIQEAL